MKHKIIIVADREKFRVGDTNIGSVPALIEIAGRKVVEYTLEDLASAGFDEAVLMSPDVSELEACLGSGGRWGIKLRYHLTRKLESASEYPRLLTGDDRALVVRGDVLRGCSIRTFVELSQNLDGGLVTAISNGNDAGIYLCGRGQDLAAGRTGTTHLEQSVEVGDIGLNRLTDCRDLHRACLSAARGEIPGFERRGKVDDYGIVSSRLSRVENVSMESGTLFVGAAAKVASDVSISGTVVIGEGAFVDKGTSLKDCVVMPGSYVGRQLDVNNAVISGADLVRIDSGAVVKVPDDHLLCTLASTHNETRPGAAISRLLGLVLAILSLPLWPFAAIAALPGRDGRLMVSHMRVGNRRHDGQPVAFKVNEFTTDIPVLRFLPWLIPVIAGHIRLVGVRPPIAGDSQTGKLRSPAGLLGPAIIDATPNATPQEIAFDEMMFGAQDSLALRLRYFARSAAAFFSGRAWRPRRGHPLVSA